MRTRLRPTNSDNICLNSILLRWCMCVRVLCNNQKIICWRMDSMESDGKCTHFLHVVVKLVYYQFDFQQHKYILIESLSVSVVGINNRRVGVAVSVCGRYGAEEKETSFHSRNYDKHGYNAISVESVRQPRNPPATNRILLFIQHY